MRLSGKIDMAALALTPIHHGKGTSGNTSLLRIEEVLTADGDSVRVPFVSGNSMKHLIRVGGVAHALEAMEVPDGTLSKPVVDLLFAGGSMSKTGSAVTLSAARRIEELFPILSLCGYSAGNTMQPSKLVVADWRPVCAENAWRMPEAMRELPLARHRAGALRSEVFGTRHEPTRQALPSRMLTHEAREAREDEVSDKVEEVTPDKGDSLQMIHEVEVLKAGTRLWGAISFEAVSEFELAALKAALSYACKGRGPDGGLVFHIGAKASVGYGQISIHFTGWFREGIRSPEFSSGDSLIPAVSADEYVEYVRHLHDHRAEIIAMLQELA